jgi:hypothetical protein
VLVPLIFNCLRSICGHCDFCRCEQLQCSRFSHSLSEFTRRSINWIDYESTDPPSASIARSCNHREIRPQNKIAFPYAELKKQSIGLQRSTQKAFAYTRTAARKYCCNQKAHVGGSELTVANSGLFETRDRNADGRTTPGTTLVQVQYGQHSQLGQSKIVNTV